MSALHNAVTQLFVHAECLHANLSAAPTGLNSAAVEALWCDTYFLSWRAPPTRDPLLSHFVLLSLRLVVSSHTPSCFDLSVLSSCSREETPSGPP